MSLWSDLRRLIYIASVLLRHLLAHLLGVRLGRWPWLAQRLPSGADSGPERLRMVFEEVGGTFVKLGQMLALQPDILPLAYCNALFKLLDRIDPFDFVETERIFREQFGREPTEIFARFAPQPLATASIGQVYAAYLGARKVAVKVQRPSVKDDFAGDIRLMTGLIRLIQTLRIRPLYWILEPLGEFVAWTREELDFRCEARYMERLRHNAQGNAQEYIPEVVWDYTTHCILTLEFLDGVTILNYIRALEIGDAVTIQRLRKHGFDPDQFAQHIVDNFLHDAFQHGMFHADLHPANLMILPNSVVGYIDFGITGVISSYMRQHLVALTLAYARGDLDGMFAAFFKVSTLDSGADMEGFRRGLHTLSSEWYMMEGKQRRLLKNITLVMLDLLKLSRQTGIWPERDVIKYIRSAIAIDGLITRFAPTFDVGQYLEMICARYLTWHGRQERFAFDALVDWSSANAHLLHDGALRALACLDRVTSSELPAGASGSAATAGSQSTQRQAIQTAGLICAVAVMMTVTGEPVRFGVNLFTAELLLMAVAATRLGRVLYQLS
jgi:predicted unusual protein kinase regulating ubiquinone biosynthesis (AarF/ABC1/UbiB family)